MAKNLNLEQKKEYNQFIKESVKNGSFFKDSLDWYLFSYVAPIYERTILFIISFIAIFSSILLTISIKESLPLNEPIPIALKAGDATKYFPTIRKLNDSAEIKSIDEAIIKHLIATYLKEREEYDFEGNSVADHKEMQQNNIKIKNTSSDQELKKFKDFQKNIPKNISRKVEIQSIYFKRTEADNLIDKAKNFVYTKIPSEATVEYEAIIKKGKKTKSRNYITKIAFEFEGISVNDKSKKDDKDDAKKKNITVQKKRLNFKVVSYKTYKAKTK